MIDTDRLAVFPEATKCIKCEKKERNESKVIITQIL